MTMYLDQTIGSPSFKYVSNLFSAYIYWNNTLLCVRVWVCGLFYKAVRISANHALRTSAMGKGAPVFNLSLRHEDVITYALEGGAR